MHGLLYLKNFASMPVGFPCQEGRQLLHWTAVAFIAYCLATCNKAAHPPRGVQWRLLTMGMTKNEQQKQPVSLTRGNTTRHFEATKEYDMTATSASAPTVYQINAPTMLLNPTPYTLPDNSCIK